MLRLLHPKVNEIFSFEHHVLIWIQSNEGWIEVDFQPYRDFQNKLIFLSPNQPIKFVFGDFKISVLEFSKEAIFQSPDYRVLFKHLISLGYIELLEKEKSGQSLLIENQPTNILDISTHQWFWQNPFQAKKEEYEVIFDLKDVIDAHFNENWSVEQFISNLHHEYISIHRLVKNRLGLTVKHLAQKKLLIESQKDIALTDKPIQEVAFDMGFKDPSYFNRFFKKQTQLTPQSFRERFGKEEDDLFVEDLRFLIQNFHIQNRSTAFYADKLFMSVPTLSRKVKDRFNTTIGELVRIEIIKTAKHLLEDLKVKECAYELGFTEANHFSSFFKKYTGETPSEYLSKKYHQ